MASHPDDTDPGRSIVTVTKQRYGVQDWSFAIRRHIDNEAGTARVVYDGDATKSQVSKASDIIGAIHALQRQLGPDAADAKTIAAWMDCSPDTVDRHAGKLVKATILARRAIAASDKGGRPKNVYDVIGGVQWGVSAGFPHAFYLRKAVWATFNSGYLDMRIAAYFSPG